MSNLFITADNHIGKNLKKIKVLRNMAIDNFKAIPDKIQSLSECPEYIILAGDIFDKENTDIQCYIAYAETLERLVNISGIKKILIITGNHDEFNEYYQTASIDIINVLKSDKIIMCNKGTKYYHDVDDDILFMLLPYNKKLFLTNENGEKIIVDTINEMIADTFNKSEYANSYKILISHFAIKEWMPFSIETVEKEELRVGGHFDLVILGDLHNETFEDTTGDTPIIYTGSTMHTSISDLYNHDNVAKVITIEDHSLAKIQHVKFDKPKVLIVDETNFETVKDTLNSKTIIITSSLDIHNNYKDRVMYSMYKPTVKSTQSVLETFDSTTSMDDLDISQLAKDKINQDTSIDDATKEYLITLVDIDTESYTAKEIAELVAKPMLGDLQ